MIRIRKANEADYPEVMALIKRVFWNVRGSGLMSLAKMRNSEFFIPELSLIAGTDDHKIVGHTFMIKVSIGDSCSSLGLAQVAVAPEHQGLTIGSLLVTHAHQKAKELGYGSVIALGGKSFLSGFGYRKMANFGIYFPYGVVEDQCLAVELYPGALTGIQGMVRFPLEYI